MYYPAHRPQLTGLPTQAVDCGVRATQMGLDWASKGQVKRSVKQIRAIMGSQGPTNYHEWDAVIDQLGGQTIGFAGTRTNDWLEVKDHMDAGNAIILAVDYGEHRRWMQRKSGSLTFDGFHGIPYFGRRRRDGQVQWRSYDSLLDGRYQGCPNGPVWVPQWKVRNAAQMVGEKEVGAKSVFAVLLHRDPNVEDIDVGDLLPEGVQSMMDTLSDLYELRDLASDQAMIQLIAASIRSLEANIGIQGNPEADGETEVQAGILLR